MTTRTISDLMSLGTYQGMTDEEIQRVMEFRMEHARRDEVAKAEIATLIQTMNADSEARAAQAEQATKDFQKVLSHKLNLGTIGTDGFPVEGDSE